MPDFVTEACDVVSQLAFLFPFQPVTVIDPSEAFLTETTFHIHTPVDYIQKTKN